ncbi:YdcF family protein [Lederbergia wuyishanensis]|uniref:Vancomycin permeability regulator SanA n=1 Tax=Lederbergia wuyishanensis TaxID=1347903 RepID=A0ABU0CYS3_9BACI|nr:YdcF family protein [Lederbergia wuyishanensis]MCJ8005924.1 YdcF family protein [Lederbergia wuyishanensis]MDQ0341289.1 vancomycin permeability regulator SanA [Lederbergia wuyishanensis]
MKISELQFEDLTDELMTKLLYSDINDDHEKGDCIMVFGSSKAVQYRLPRAIQLYQEGRANKLLFSGGVAWNGNDLPEAIVLKNKAMELGIPEEDILIETISTNTKENILASLLVLDRYCDLHKIKRILIVTASYHMKRTYLTLKTYMPSWIEFSLCPAEDQSTKQDNWFLNVHGRKRVTEESRKIISYIREGAIVDATLP